MDNSLRTSLSLAGPPACWWVLLPVEVALNDMCMVTCRLEVGCDDELVSHVCSSFIRSFFG